MIGAIASMIIMRPMATIIPPVVEGAFDFIVETTPYVDPSGEGPFDFKVEV